MIYGQQVTLAGPISSQPPSEAVKNLQKVMLAISKLANEPDYDPTRGGVYPISGKVGFHVASGLYAMAHDLANQGVRIPVIGDVVNKLINFPGVSAARSCLRDRFGKYDPCSFEGIWNIVKLADEDWLRRNVVNPIRDGAGDIDRVLKPIADRMKTEGGAGKTEGGAGMQTLVFNPNLVTATAFPDGTVAVRDPILGKYRLIAPAK